jgi:beta-lactamase regulating signal transducer with metallopeptidase domain
MDTTLLLKATALLLVTLFAGRLLRNSPAAARHRYWSGAFAALLLLPVLVLTLPAVVVPLPVSSPPPVSPPLLPVVDVTPHPSVPPSGVADFSPPAPEPRRTEVRRSTGPVARPVFPLRTVLLSAWAAGTSVALAALLLSLWRVRRLARAAEELHDPQWTAAAAEIAERFGLRRPVRLLVSEAVATPMAGGLLRPTAFLPSSSRQWTPEQRDVVLAHEISHMASRDPLRHLLTRLTVTLYWFHPLTWIAAREANAAREEACDAAVLALGTLPSLYATVLLDLAESLPRRPRMLAALPMAQRSRLETRLMTILEDSRPSTRRLALIPLLLMTPVTVMIAAAQAGRPATPPVVAAFVTPAAPADSPKPPDAPPDVPQLAMQAVTVRPAEPARPAHDWSDCWNNSFEGSFTGSISTSDDGANVEIHERIGRRGSTRVIQKRFGDLRLCMVAEGVGDGDLGAPSQWLDNASRWVMEVRGDGLLQKLEDRGGQLSWSTGGRQQPIDASVEAWRTRMLALFDAIWELSSLRGEVSSLRGEISSVHGEHSSLRGEISSLQGHVSSLRGEISSILGEESSMRGEISSIRGHLSSLHGQISSERGAISSLNAGQYRATASERASIASIVARHEAEIERIEQEIRDYDADAKVAAVERRIAGHDTDGKVAAVEAQIRAFDLSGKVAEIERRITALDVNGKVSAIEQKIAALDADRRGRELEKRVEQQLRQLEETIRAMR